MHYNWKLGWLFITNPILNDEYCMNGFTLHYEKTYKTDVIIMIAYIYFFKCISTFKYYDPSPLTL